MKLYNTLNKKVEEFVPIDGNNVKMQVKKGDRVIISKYSGTEVKYEGVDYTIVRQNDILAIVED